MEPHPANYDFIMNPAPPPRKTLFGGGSSMATRLLVVVVGLFILVAVAGILLQTLTKGGGKFDKAAVLAVAQDQTEIIRVSTLGTQNSVSQTNKNFSATTKLGMTSEQRTLLTYLADNGYKPKDKALLLKQDSQTDAQLEAAKSSSTFDTVYSGIMKKQLTAYQQDLSAAYNSAHNATAKAFLKARYNTAEMLLTQLSAQN